MWLSVPGKCKGHHFFLNGSGFSLISKWLKSSLLVLACLVLVGRIHSGKATQWLRVASPLLGLAYFVATNRADLMHWLHSEIVWLIRTTTAL